MHRTNIFFIYIAICIFLISLISLYSTYKINADMPVIKKKSDIVKNLSITDLCLSTEARYTRHPSQADIFSPFQHYPGSIEHFPSGSVIPPPEFNFSSEIKLIK